MGDIEGFMKIERSEPKTLSVEKRLKSFNEFYKPSSEHHKKDQASRCMDCGVPFCHSGCPLGNIIPDFNNAVFHNDWDLAYEILSSTNNFPEFTGRICPAPCEGSCVLGINSDPVTIEYIEKSIIEKAYASGLVKPKETFPSTHKKIAIVGSGPAGLAAADQLNLAGHTVTVFEKSDKIGGLLRYGIPDFKLEKSVIDRRLKILEEEGIAFKQGVNVGIDISVDSITAEFDAIVLAGGSSVPRNLDVEGRNLKGISYAMDFLTASNKHHSGDFVDPILDVQNKNVVVIGGGDTGSDCIGTSNRLGAKSITQIELLSKPPLERSQHNPWPLWPMIYRTSSSQEEGCEREWSISTKRFLSDDGVHLSGIEVVRLEWKLDDKGNYQMIEIEGSSHVIECDVVFLAMGFLHPLHNGLLQDLGVQLDSKQNVETNHFKTSVPKVFAAGDMRRGQSLVVWAISEGREVAIEVDKFLTGINHSVLESNAKSVLSL